MLTCKNCSAPLDVTEGKCPSCGTEAPIARLLGMLGIVCLSCEAYNDPGARICVACGKSLGLSHASDGPERSAPAEPVTTEPVVAAGHFDQARPTVRLVLVEGTGEVGAMFDLPEGEAPVGRACGPFPFPEDPCLALHHATFVVREGTLTVRDEGAPGGIFVRIRKPAPIAPGGYFALGDRLFLFVGTLPASPPQAPDGTIRLGAPRPDAAFVVEERLEGGVAGRTFVRAGPSFTMGRAGSSSIELPEPGALSDEHAEVAVASDGQAELQDLGSSSGTFVRGAANTLLPLVDGDTVRLGREVLRVQIA